jgi:plasmid stabilization system protein ParE
MTTAYVLTALAEADLDDTWDYVAENFGFDLADRVLASLQDAFRLLAENPDLGHSREDIAPLPYSCDAEAP